MNDSIGRNLYSTLLQRDHFWDLKFPEGIGSSNVDCSESHWKWGSSEHTVKYDCVLDFFDKPCSGYLIYYPGCFSGNHCHLWFLPYVLSLSNRKRLYIVSGHRVVLVFGKDRLGKDNPASTMHGRLKLHLQSKHPIWTAVPRQFHFSFFPAEGLGKQWRMAQFLGPGN